MLTFADRLCCAIQSKETPLIVGLDPRWELLPSPLTQDGKSGGSHDLAAKANAIGIFCREIIDVVFSLVPAVKPQAAFFEQLGPEGMRVLANVVDYAKSRGLLVIMDAKRGDIGSTAEAYAEAYLGEKPKSTWGCDALTVNPYLGEDSLTPFIKAAAQNHAGIFVLVKTSNLGSQQLQELRVDSEPVYSRVARQVQTLTQLSTGRFDFGCVGSVVGATYPQQLAELRHQMPNAILLIPGFGAQGGTAKDVAGGFREDGLGAIVNSSRGIIFAHSNQRYSQLSDWQKAVEMATRDAIAEIASETAAGKLVTSP
jgi:orotidine-5'-phosphate decarboxylase